MEAPIKDASGPEDVAALHAYVDGELDEAQRRRVEALAARDPKVAEALASYAAQREALRASFAPIAREAVPPRLLAATARARAPRLAALAASLVLGVALGSAATWQLLPGPGGGAREARGAELPRFVRQAEIAHAVFVPDVRRPVEVGAAEEPALEAWLGKRLGRPIDAPSRLPLGLALVGGRLLPGEADRPAAQLMYENARGQRLTVYLRSMAQPTPETAFRYERARGSATFYWVDRDWGYALTGELPRAELLQVAQYLYEKLNPRE